MFSHCQFAIYNIVTVLALICHIKTYPKLIRELPMMIGKRHTL